MQTLDRLKQHITGNKLKITEVAMAAGIPPDRLRKWLEGRGNPKAADSAKIEAYLKGEKRPEEVPAVVKGPAVPYSLDKDKLIARLETLVDVNLNDLREKVGVIEETLKRIEDLMVREKEGEPERGFVRQYKSKGQAPEKER